MEPDEYSEPEDANIDTRIASETGTIRSQDTGQSNRPSPTSSRSRRLRDEEAQSEMQANISPKYHDFTFKNDDHAKEEDEIRPPENVARRTL
jgi:uncharacterized protein YdaU (DUF1376 family)